MFVFLFVSFIHGFLHIYVLGSLISRWAARPTTALRCDCAQFGGYERVACALSNSAGCVNPVARCVAKAREMFAIGAYLHQYKAHGVEQSEFAEAFRDLDQIVLNYRSL